MGRPGKGMATSLDISTKIQNKKQKAKFFVTDVTNQNFRNFLKNFGDSPYLGYNSKQIHDELIKA